MKPRSYKFNTLLEIDWIDISDNNSWLTPYQAMHLMPCKCKSAGYFLNQDENVIRISPTIQIETKDRGSLVIPWGCITGIKKHE